MTKRSIWFSLRGSLWFVPLLMLMAGAALALGLVQIDLRFNTQLNQHWPKALSAGPEGARAILTAIAGSMITVAGVVFSITIVTLSLAANQYSPRVLRNFMRDLVNQMVLGLFVGVFAYSLLVLQAIRTDDTSFVPQLALWFGIVLVIVSIGFLIAFIHHIAASIQASEMISRIADETLSALNSARRISSEGGATVDIHKDKMPLQWQSIPSHESGYIQDIDVEKLFALACKRQIIFRVECPVGDFVVAGRPLVSFSGEIAADKKLSSSVQQLFGINSYRTIEQDPAFGIRQIVDIALKALSPGINDTTTAIHCIDYIGVILHHAIQLTRLPDVHEDRGKPRLMLPQHGTDHLLDIALNEIRQNARGNVAVLLRLLRLLRQLREDVKDSTLRAHLRNHALLIAEDAKCHTPELSDQSKVMQALEKTLGAKPED